MKFGKQKKDFNYFTSFCKVGEIAVNAAEYLNKTLVKFDAKQINVYASAMHELETSADLKRHELCKNLAHEFMPPIEREDISQLSQYLDNVVDCVEDVMRKIYMFNITEIRKDAIEFSELVTDGCNQLGKLLCEFSDFKKSKHIHDYIVEINTIENKGDRLHAEAIRRLISKEVPAESQFAWTMVFEAFEKSLDACESVADIIDSIITKNT